MLPGRKSLLSLLTVLLVVPLPSAAQPMRVTPAERTERLTKELALNGEQRERVLAIFTAADEKMQTAFKNRSGDRRAMRTTMQEIRKETEAGMQGVLTPEQFTRWQQQRERAPRGGKIPPPHN